MNFIERVKKLNFPMGEYVVVGSGLLDALGLREAKDIDVATTEKLTQKLRAAGGWKEETRFNKLFLIGDGVEVITILNWDKYSTIVEEAIRTAMIIDGVPFMNIEETILFKTALGREKDFKDIDLLQKYKENNKK